MLSLSDIVNVKVGIGRGVFEAPGATVIGGKKPSFNLEILKLFANGEQGFYQDPYDLGVMYQDAAGTTVVNTAGQPLGLVLDKSKGLVLGPELITNGDFSKGLDGWAISGADATHTITPVGNGVRYVSDTSTPVLSIRSVGLTLTVGRWYKITITVSNWVSGAIKTDAFLPANLQLASSAGTFTYYGQASSTGFSITRNSPNVDLVISSVSLKELKGNHAYQATSASRPILQDAPRRIDFDTVDDKLITNLPAQLTGCTVIRAVPGVGAQILTNQTIPATYEDNKDHCGLIVINRALTPSETSAIAAEFNKRAGV